MLTLIAIFSALVFSAPESARDRIARLRAETEFARRANETENGFKITSITPSDIDIGRNVLVKIQLDPIQSDFCTVRFGESLVRGFVDNHGIVSVRAPSLKGGVYLVSVSYDREHWSNERAVIFRAPLESGMWLLAFPAIVTLVLVGVIMWCGTFGICSPQKRRTPRALQTRKPQRWAP